MPSNVPVGTAAGNREVRTPRRAWAGRLDRRPKSGSPVCPVEGGCQRGRQETRLWRGQEAELRSSSVPPGARPPRPVKAPRLDEQRASDVLQPGGTTPTWLERRHHAHGPDRDRRQVVDRRGSSPRYIGTTRYLPNREIAGLPHLTAPGGLGGGLPRRCAAGCRGQDQRPAAGAGSRDARAAPSSRRLVIPSLV
jgi:hypothetical protein